uniref:Uncharacterized protein n=1 Tax=Arcella intermedia TaxID=1963864 RepID=A0A6B2LM33_9EUKA
MRGLDKALKEGKDSAVLRDGYAPFCKHIFIKNFIPGLKLSTVPITPQNESLIVSDYLQRTEKELPVLVRWLPKDKVTVPDAKWMDLILYSKEQIDKEREAMGEPPLQVDYDYGIISIKVQDENYETPMDPITVMRNALGKEQGGSGVPLDREKYIQSVNYWKSHVMIK